MSCSRLSFFLSDGLVTSPIWSPFWDLCKNLSFFVRYKKSEFLSLYLQGAVVQDSLQQISAKQNKKKVYLLFKRISDVTFLFRTREKTLISLYFVSKFHMLNVTDLFFSAV